MTTMRYLVLVSLFTAALSLDVSKYHGIGGSSCTMAKYFAVFNGGFVPLCKPDGTFKQNQCYDGWCWCVEEESGEEVPNTRVEEPGMPNCEYVAFAATEVDLVNVISKERDDKIEIVPDVFMSKPAYHFSPSSSINAPLKHYLPPTLWSEFSILVTMKPEELEGGFLFAVMDNLESVVQFGLSISRGDNDYTQVIDLWYTQNVRKGSSKLASFTVPLMVDRWSRFALSVMEDKVNLFVYCHNYTVLDVTRSQTSLSFSEGSLLVIGHAGGLIQQDFKGHIQELLISNSVEDAALQCDESYQREVKVWRTITTSCTN